MCTYGSNVIERKPLAEALPSRRTSGPHCKMKPVLSMRNAGRRAAAGGQRRSPETQGPSEGCPKERSGIARGHLLGQEHDSLRDVRHPSTRGRAPVRGSARRHRPEPSTTEPDAWRRSAGRTFDRLPDPQCLADQLTRIRPLAVKPAHHCDHIAIETNVPATCACRRLSVMCSTRTTRSGTSGLYPRDVPGALRDSRTHRRQV